VHLNVYSSQDQARVVEKRYGFAGAFHLI